MQPMLRIHEVAELLAVTPNAAKNWLKRNRVPMVDFGVGRGLGKRWMRDDIMSAIEGATIRIPDKAEKSRVPRMIDRPLYGKSRKEQLDAIQGGRIQ